MIHAVIAAFMCFACLHATKAERAYMFKTPRVLSRDGLNKMTLTLYEVNSPGSVILRLVKSENETVLAEQKYDIESGVTETDLEFQVPSNTEYEAKLQIAGTFQDYEFAGEDVVSFKDSNSKIVFIQTDKSIYKVGQQVKFRVLPLNSKLKPLGSNIVGDIWIENPTGNRVAQWKNQPLGKGIHQNELPLSEEADYGHWKITASIDNDEHSTTFEVKEYVLPKFEVVINPPSYVLVDSEVIPIDICAKYTYGKLVDGVLAINATVEAYSWSNQKFPIVEYEVEFKGCHKYYLNASLVDPNFSYSYRRLKIFAEVKEKGTGIARNETHYITRTQTPLQISFETDGKYFKPGLPYKGKVKVAYPDETPAPSEPIQLCLTVARERRISGWWATRKLKYCRNYTSDEKGNVHYSLPSQNTDAVSMNVEAKSLKYGNGPTEPNKPTLYNPQTSTFLRPWYSPSGSHLQVQDIGGKFECDTKENITVLFTTKKSDTFHFYYEIVTRSRVVKKGYAEVEFDEKDNVGSEVSSQDITLEGEATQIVPPPTDSSSEIEREDDDDLHCKSMKEAKFVPLVGKFDIHVDIKADLSPSFHLLVYYIRGDRETVADSQQFSVQKCLDNKVSLKFGDEVKQPGTKTSLSLEASPNSFCGVKVVDKSTQLMGSNDQLNKKKIFEELDRIDAGRYYPRNHCNDKQQPGLPKKLASMIYPPRPPRPWSSSSYEDAFTAFEKTGFSIISDLILLTRPCKNSGPSYESYGGIALASVDVRGGAAQRRPAPASAFAAAASHDNAYEKTSAEHSTKSVVDVRNFFPETWLFEVVTTGESGILQTKYELPHTITEWSGNAVCISEEKGIGLSEVATIRGFQAFFVSFTLPYSVIRGEKVPVIVTIFNYLDKCLPIALSVEQSGDYILLSGSSETELCVCGGESDSYRFYIQPTILGTLNLTVYARSASSSVVCGETEVSDAVAKDAITNSLIVEAEGYPQEDVTSFLFCPKDAQNGVFKKSHSLAVPNDTVVDSERAFVSVSGDIMGPTVKGMDKLVQLPTGCGEQNMVLFAPIIQVLDYLYFTNQLTEVTKNKGLDFLKKGYQRQLRYRHSDGSYSAFGPSDKEGSLWLTAFVLRHFSLAQKYIEIDQASLNQTRSYIFSKQQENGCFREVGRTLSHALKGGLDKQNSTNVSAFTAFVITSLMISGVQNDEMTEKALSCIEMDTDLTPYTASLYGYAAALAGSQEAAEYYIDHLFEKANDTGEQMFWRNNGLSKSVDIETAAYVILTLLKLDSPMNKIAPIVRWIARQRNSNGGFDSTQDTVVGLEAVSKFALLLSKEPTNLNIGVSGGAEKKVTVTDDDKLVVQQFKVDRLPSDIDIEASGTGCGVMQTILKYNTREQRQKGHFTLTVEAGRTPEEGCKYATINVCTSYLPQGKKSNMALVQINMVSGMVPVKESIETLKDDRKLELKRHDFENNNLVLYFDELSNSKKCFEFVVEEITVIDERKPANAKVFDYYAPEHNQMTNYEIGDCKGI